MTHELMCVCSFGVRFRYPHFAGVITCVFILPGGPLQLKHRPQPRLLIPFGEYGKTSLASRDLVFRVAISFSEQDGLPDDRITISKMNLKEMQRRMFPLVLGHDVCWVAIRSPIP